MPEGIKRSVHISVYHLLLVASPVVKHDGTKRIELLYENSWTDEATIVMLESHDMMQTKKRRKKNQNPGKPAVSAAQEQHGHPKKFWTLNSSMILRLIAS